MKRIIYIFFLLLLFTTEIFASKSSEFEYLKKTIQSVHKDFYNANSKTECEKVFNDLVKNIDNSDDAPWEITADLLGGVDRNYNSDDIKQGWNYFSWGRLIGPF